MLIYNSKRSFPLEQLRQFAYMPDLWIPHLYDLLGIKEKKITDCGFEFTSTNSFNPSWIKSSSYSIKQINLTINQSSSYLYAELNAY